MQGGVVGPTLNGAMLGVLVAIVRAMNVGPGHVTGTLRCGRQAPGG